VSDDRVTVILTDAARRSQLCTRDLSLEHNGITLDGTQRFHLQTAINRPGIYIIVQICTAWCSDSRFSWYRHHSSLPSIGAYWFSGWTWYYM